VRRLHAIHVGAGLWGRSWAELVAGAPGYQAEAWYGLFAAAGTPVEVIGRLNAAVRQAMRSDAFRKRIDDEGLVPAGGPPEELERYVRAEEIRWARVVQDARIKETP